MLTETSKAQLTQLFGLEGQIAVITGAARGLGRATALLLASAGARLALADREAEGLRAVADTINASNGQGSAIAIPTDVSDSGSVRALFATASEGLGEPGVLVNFAGVTDRITLDDMSAADYDRIHGVNSRGTFLCVREAIPRMITTGRGGSIINISSVASIRAATLHGAAYAASKAAVNALTTSTALEVGRYNIRVNAVLPGGFPGERSVREREAGNVPPEGPLTHLDRIPLGRYGRETELAAVVLFLASPASSYVTGQLIAVDGGFLVG